MRYSWITATPLLALALALGCDGDTSPPAAPPAPTPAEAPQIRTEKDLLRKMISESVTTPQERFEAAEVKRKQREAKAAAAAALVIELRGDPYAVEKPEGMRRVDEIPVEFKGDFLDHPGGELLSGYVGGEIYVFTIRTTDAPDNVMERVRQRADSAGWALHESEAAENDETRMLLISEPRFLALTLFSDGEGSIIQANFSGPGWVVLAQ